MNGTELIDEVIDYIDDDNLDRTVILRRLNAGLRYISGRVLLPTLSDGHATLHTATNDCKVNLPTDFARELYWATTPNNQLMIYPNTLGMLEDGFKLSSETGTLLGVSAVYPYLYYVRTPTTSTDITIYCYPAFGCMPR